MQFDYNYEKLRANGHLVAKIQTRHSGHGASAATSDEACGIELVKESSCHANM